MGLLTQQSHAALSPDIRDAAWTSNCAGEIFVATGADQELRLGHFQGDAALASFVVAAHAECCPPAPPDSRSSPEEVLRDLVAQLVSFPSARCCKHWAAASVLSAMERMGLPVSKELAAAVVDAEDAVALKLLQPKF